MDDTELRRAEVRELAGLGLAELAGAAIGTGQVHRGVSDAVFAGLAPLTGGRSAPVQILHDGIAEAVYSGVIATLQIGSRVAAVTADLPGRPPSQTVRGAKSIAVITGLIGDELAARESVLADPPTIRRGGRPVGLSRRELAESYPGATSRIAVYLHGLVETEHDWDYGETPRYGVRMADELGITEVQVRYNTGSHISENGRLVARLLAELTTAWPVPVTSISLIGHSMGGLVARSACHYGRAAEAAWVTRVRHVVYLGSPHLGAPLARLVHHGTGLLRNHRITRPFGDLLRRRSRGIRDLFHGSIVEDDWSGRDPDGPDHREVTDVPLLDTAIHLVVTATLAGDPHHPVARLVGDGMVLVPSGRGRNRFRCIGLPLETAVHVSRAHHFSLLNDEAVYQAMASLLRPLPELPPGTSVAGMRDRLWS